MRGLTKKNEAVDILKSAWETDLGLDILKKQREHVHTALICTHLKLELTIFYPHIDRYLS